MATVGVVLAMKAVAVAEAAGDATPADLTAAPSAPGPATPPQNKAATSCPPPGFAEQAGLSATEVDVLQSLGARRTELDARAADIDTQSALLDATQKRVDDRLAELKRVEAAVTALLVKTDDAQNAQADSMVTVYSKMKSKDAARIFDDLDDDVLVQVASRMKQAVLAEILGSMGTEKARKLTKMLIMKDRLPTDLLTRAAQTVQAGQAPAATKPPT